MQHQSSSRPSQFTDSQREAGVVILMMALILTVLLFIIGLAIDSGNLYRAKLSLQSSVDAAAIAGIGYTTSLGKFELDQRVKASQGNWSTRAQRDTKVASFLSPRTNDIVHAMMDRAGYPHVTNSVYQIQLTNTFDSPDIGVPTDRAYSYRVVARRRVDFFLMDAIPGFLGSDFLEIEAAATAERKVATIVTYLDVSDSMNCPAAGSCDCLLVPGSGTCAAGTKMDRLIDAMSGFLKMFDPERDRLYVVPFNVRGVVFSLQEFYDDHPILGNMEDLTEAKINQLLTTMRGAFNPQSSTNLCDALMRSRSRLGVDGFLDDPDVTHVIFSDGAPTAGRFLFSQPRAGLLPWDVQAGGAYDYTHYSVQWREVGNASNVVNGPAILVQSNLLGMNLDSPVPPAAGTGTNDDGSPSAAGWGGCGYANPAAPLTPVPNANALGGVATSVFNPCVESLGSHLPGQAGATYGTQYRSAGPKQFADWQEMYYNCAIELTDQFRNEGATVHVIGLGDPANFPRNVGNTLTDPYQVATDVSKRHDIFNARLAAHTLRAQEPIDLPAGVPQQPYPEWNYDGYTPYADLGGGVNAGQYFPTANAAELERLFRQIAQEILLRMTE